MIISFVIFVAFIFAIFYFLSPFGKKEVSYTSLDRVQARILGNLTLNYQQIALVLNRAPCDSCNCFAIGQDIGLGEKVLVKDKTFSLGYRLTPGEKIEVQTNPEARVYDFFKANPFKNLGLTSSNCDALLEGSYAFGALTNEKKILYEYLQELNANYIKDYELLKSKLNIEGDFNFVVYDIDRKVVFNDSLQINNPQNIRVISREIPLIAINQNANFKSLILNLRAW